MKQKFPPGWNQKKVLTVIAHYDRQTEEEAAAEIETASEATGDTWMSVPVELVGVVSRLIEDHAKKGAIAPAHNHKNKVRTKKAKSNG